jgi:hypothetical protein
MRVSVARPRRASTERSEPIASPSYPALRRVAIAGILAGRCHEVVAVLDALYDDATAASRSPVGRETASGR